MEFEEDITNKKANNANANANANTNTTTTTTSRYEVRCHNCGYLFGSDLYWLARVKCGAHMRYNNNTTNTAAAAGTRHFSYIRRADGIVIAETTEQK